MEEKQIIIEYNNVDICQEENVVLADVCFTLSSHQFVYLLGKVGSGKSSFMKTIYNELPIKRGEARAFNYDLRKIRRRDVPMLRRKLGVVFQDFQLLPDRSVHDNLEFVLKATGWKDAKQIESQIDFVLQTVSMSKKGYKWPHQLSGGEQQRIVIARALLNSPELILADEPTGNLDSETGSEIMALFHAISASGTAVIMATHNEKWTNMFPARCVTCVDGKMIE